MTPFLHSSQPICPASSVPSRRNRRPDPAPSRWLCTAVLAFGTGWAAGALLGRLRSPAVAMAGGTGRFDLRPHLGQGSPPFNVGVQFPLLGTPSNCPPPSLLSLTPGQRNVFLASPLIFPLYPLIAPPPQQGSTWVNPCFSFATQVEEKGICGLRVNYIFLNVSKWVMSICGWCPPLFSGAQTAAAAVNTSGGRLAEGEGGLGLKRRLLAGSPPPKGWGAAFWTTGL